MANVLCNKNIATPTSPELCSSTNSPSVGILSYLVTFPWQPLGKAQVWCDNDFMLRTCQSNRRPANKLNTLKHGQNSHHSPDDFFKNILFNEKFYILIQISMFVPEGPIDKCTSRLVVQQLVRFMLTTKKTSKHCCWPVNPLTKGQYCWQYLPVMTSACLPSIL